MSAPEKIAFFGHHKCGSRFFRMSLLAPLLTANGYEVLKYDIRERPFHFRLAHELDLRNIEFDRFSEPGRKLLNLSNASGEVVAETFKAAPDLRGVHVVRDPRQVLVSDYFHHREGHNVESPVGWVWDALKEDRPHLLALPLEDGLIYELDHITHDVFENQLAAWRQHPNVIEFRMEEFAGADGYDWPAMARLVEFLGVEERPPLKFEQVFANAEAKSWRDVFTPRLTDLFKRRWGQLLIDLGYERDLDW